MVRPWRPRASVEAGNDPRLTQSTAMTVGLLVESYLSKHVRPSLRGAYQVERRLRKNVVPVIGDIRLADLHRRDINRVTDAILTRGRHTEAARVSTDLRAMLRWAVARGDLDRDPAAGMSLPAQSQPRDRVLSPAEIVQLWNSLPSSGDYQGIIRLCLITAQRVGEVAGITAQRTRPRTATVEHPRLTDEERPCPLCTAE